MPKAIVDTDQHGRVEVDLGADYKPQGEEALRSLVQKKLEEGTEGTDWRALPSEQEPASMLHRANEMYKTAAAAATTAVAGAIDATAAYGPMAGPIAGAVSSAPPSAAAQWGAQTIVPQTPLEAGIFTGTLGAGGVATNLGAKGFTLGLARVLGAGAGAAAGGAAEGRDPTDSAVLGLFSGLVGEAASFAASRLYRFGSERIARIIQRADASNAGSVVKTQVPALGEINVTPDGQIVRGPSLFNAETPEQWRNLVMGDRRTNGLKVLGDAQDKIEKMIESRLQPVDTGSTTYKTPPKFTSPEDPNRMIPFGAVRTELKQLRERAYMGKQGDPATATALGVDAKAAYEKALDKFRQELTAADPQGAATALFDAGREQYRVGRNLLESFEPAFRKTDNKRVIFDTEALQKYWSKEQNFLGEMLGVDTFDAMWGAIGRGAKPGMADTAGRSNAFGLIPRSTIGAAVEGVRALTSGTRYVGTTPVDMSSGVRSAISAGIGQAAGGMLNEAPVKVDDIPGALRNLRKQSSSAPVDSNFITAGVRG